MAKIDLTVEMNDESILSAIAEVRKKQRELNEAVGTLESIITGQYAEIVPEAAVIKEMGQGIEIKAAGLTGEEKKIVRDNMKSVIRRITYGRKRNNKHPLPYVLKLE